MTALDKIVKYLKSRKTGATAPEIAKYAKVNYNTVRRVLGQMTKMKRYSFNDYISKCRVTGKRLTAYHLA